MSDGEISDAICEGRQPVAFRFCREENDLPSQRKRYLRTQCLLHGEATAFAARTAEIRRLQQFNRRAAFSWSWHWPADDCASVPALRMHRRFQTQSCKIRWADEFRLS